MRANYRAGVDAGSALLFAFDSHWPGTTQRFRLYYQFIKHAFRPQLNIGISTETPGALRIGGQPLISTGALSLQKWNTTKNSPNPKTKPAPPNLHESLTHNVRLRLKQSHYYYEPRMRYPGALYHVMSRSDHSNQDEPARIHEQLETQKVQFD